MLCFDVILHYNCAQSELQFYAEMATHQLFESLKIQNFHGGACPQTPLEWLWPLATAFVLCPTSITWLATPLLLCNELLWLAD